MTASAALPVLLWTVAAARVPTLWRGRRQQMFWLTLTTAALIETAELPPVEHATHMSILPHLFGVLCAFFLLRFLATLTATGGIRWQLTLVASVLVALLALALAAGGIGTSAGLLSEDLSAPTVAYWVVLEVYLGTVLAVAARLFWVLARDAPPGLPRLGLRLITIGQGMIVLYAAGKTVLIVARGAGVPVHFATVAPAGRTLQVAGTLLAVVGALVPAVRKLRSVGAAYRSLLALRPLWTAMRDAFPEVILFSPRRAVIEMAGVDDVDLRLYRRVIEIRDGMLALRPYLSGVSPETPEAEAAAIAAALRRRADGVSPSDESHGFAPVGPAMADEVAWLSRVSLAYRRCAFTGVPARTPRPSGSAR